jgi:uncharacterized membrane protein YfcA
MPSALELLLVGLAAVGAGLVNAIAGGGTLISFPALIAIGVPAVAASITNTVALSPGYLGATFAQAKDLQGQKPRMWLILPAAATGGLVGGLILLNTSEAVFRVLVPVLILLSSALLAIQEPLRRRLLRRAARSKSGALSERLAVLPVGLAAIYGGYFGAGLSVMVLAVLGLLLDDTLTRVNALKQAVSFSVNIAAAVLFVFTGRVVWPAAIVMALGALVGGALGGRLAGRLKPVLLRQVVVLIGVFIAVIYLLRL